MFFICPADGTGSGIGRIRAVSFFGPDDGGSGAGMTDADNGGENEGVFTGRENWLEARFSADSAPASMSVGVWSGALPTGSRTGSWIRTVCLMSGSAIEGTKSIVELIDRK